MPLHVMQGGGGGKCDIEVFFNNTAEQCSVIGQSRAGNHWRTQSFCLWQLLHAPDKLDETDHKRQQKHFYPLMHQCLIISPSQRLSGDFFRIHFAATLLLKGIRHSTSCERIFPLDGGLCLVSVWVIARVQGHRISLGVNKAFQIQILCHFTGLKVESVTQPVKTCS